MQRPGKEDGMQSRPVEAATIGDDGRNDSADDAAIVFRNASIRRGDRIIWQHGDFSIPAGSVTAIVGTNGTGKTTMMNAELGLLPLASGSLKVLGKPAGALNHLIGYVPQSYTSEIDSNLTAEQSVLLGLTGTRFGIHLITKTQRAKAYEAMTFTGIADKAKYRLSQLSGGLRQRVAIAQALVSDPKLLMLDEPLANLDLASQRATVHVLSKLNRELGMTIQVVAHDLNMLLPILTGAVYLLDGHPHYAAMNEVLDADLLTHLYGTTVQVVTTPQGDMFVTPSPDEPDSIEQDTHDPAEVAHFHHHHASRSTSLGAEEEQA
jgi:zinc/manganese transport system ATP-binding protein